MSKFSKIEFKKVIPASIMLLLLNGCGGSGNTNPEPAVTVVPPPASTPVTGKIDLTGIENLDLLVISDAYRTREIADDGTFYIPEAESSEISMFLVQTLPELEPVYYAYAVPDGEELLINGDSSALYLATSILPEFLYAETSTIGQFSDLIKNENTPLTEFSNAITQSVQSNDRLIKSDVSDELDNVLRWFFDSRVD